MQLVSHRKFDEAPAGGAGEGKAKHFPNQTLINIHASM